MSDFFSSIDTSIFFFINHTLSNPILDILMPFLTDMNKKPVVIILVAILWAWLMAKGGRTGRTVGIMLVVTITCTDQLSSTLVKHMIHRIRPCHVMAGVRLLVDCGSGYSFPSSHAVNNFAGATVLSRYYRKYTWGWFGFASLVALSRPYVGVHYPSDIIGGAFLGTGCALVIICCWSYIEKKYLVKNSAPQ